MVGRRCGSGGASGASDGPLLLLFCFISAKGWELPGLPVYFPVAGLLCRIVDLLSNCGSCFRSPDFGPVAAEPISLLLLRELWAGARSSSLQLTEWGGGPWPASASFTGGDARCLSIPSGVLVGLPVAPDFMPVFTGCGEWPMCLGGHLLGFIA